MATAILLIVLVGSLVATAALLSLHLQRVYEGRPGRALNWLRPIEHGIYRLLRVDPEHDMGWASYARAVLAFSFVSSLALYALQRLQGVLPLNPADMKGVRPDLAFNTAVSFVTNTNWQSYSPELTMSYLTQMSGLAVQNFVSAAVGMAVAVAMVRGFCRSESRGIGNFWADMVRGTLYVLLPLALVVGVVLLARGAVQTFDGPAHVQTLSGATQTIARGPFAGQEAIKELGTNGGGSFNANSAHPYENPTPFTNLLEIWSLLLIPFAMPFLFGRMVGRMREGVALLAAMLLLLGTGFGISLAAETRTTPALTAAGLTHAPNMEGKEQRFTIQESSIFSVATTGTSTGAVDSMHDSFTAIGGAVPMTMMLLGEVAPGGVGTGLYSILLFATLTVFIAGLMVGRTPEFLGKSIGAREVKLATLGVLVMPIGFLVSLGVSSVIHDGLAGPLNAGPHGLSEILYALASTWNNNGSAFAGLTAATNYYDYLLGAAMVFGRFLVILPALGLAGSLAAQRTRPASSGSMPTSSPIFVGLLIGVILLVGALSFFPALALGPLSEALTGRLW
jgi:potassium-transporting ATPase potassium-binding subunit